MYLTSVFWMGVLAIVASLCFGVWRLFLRSSPSLAAVGSLAIGAALVTLVSSTAVRYVLIGYSTGSVTWVPIVLTLLVFVGVFVFGRLRYGFGLVGLGLAACVAFIPLVYFGFYSGLFVACSFGDCL